jgi:LPS export ABC transporter protein LptC
MKKIGIKIIFYSVTIFIVTLFFACESNFKDIQKINFSEFMPTGNADTINLKYTDSGIVKSILKSPKMLDYGSVAYPFTEFPNGVDLTLIDKNGQTNFVKADYAITFKNTNIIDMQGNVRLISSSNEVLTTEQLYYDQSAEWFFTEKKFTFTNEKGVTKGNGIDFNKNFTRVKFKNVYAESDQVNQ